MARRRPPSSHSSTPDVVLMDLRMPRVDGIEATGACSCRTPIDGGCVLTTSADDESILHAVRARAIG
jgi:DNA-binding NarL/FixJ family response regulator